MAPAARRSTGLTIDARAREATVRGHAVALTNQEFDLLQVLASDSGPSTREQLLERAWKDDPYVTVATVDVVVSSIRRKIERDAQAPQLIVGGRDSSYRLVDAD